jgi:hypothetical protein
MTRYVGPDSGMAQVDVAGKRVTRAKDGTFNFDGAAERIIKESGDFAQVGITFKTARSWTCDSCDFHSLYRDRCGRCGSTSLTPSEG